MGTVFFDTEFTGLHKNTTLISIGLIDSNDNEFYAEFTDYDKTQVDDWINENVISRLQYCGVPAIRKSESRTAISGTREEISEELCKWLNKNNTDTVQFVSDVSHYDFVLLIDLLTNGGTALDLPSNISPVCYDINHDISKFYRISEREAFDKSREKIARVDTVASKHNALWDAHVIQKIYKKLYY